MTLIISKSIDGAFCNPTGKICASTDGQKGIEYEDIALNGLSWLC